MTLLMLLMVLMAAGWAQSLMPPLLVLGQARPPLIAAVVVFYAVHFPLPVMLTAAILGGILYDANTLLPLGVSSLYYCIVGLLLREYRAFWLEGGAVSAALLSAVTALAQPWVTAMIGVAAWERSTWFPGGWLWHLSMTVCLALPAGVVVWRVGRRLHRMTGTLEETLT